MKKLCALAFLSLAVFPPLQAAAQQVTVVDMIPDWMSNENNTDSEPNLAVDPATPLHMAASAFTFDLGNSGKAPIFVSTDGGQSWDLKPILPPSVPGTGLCTAGFCDITLRFAGTSGKLYVSSMTADDKMNITYRVHRFDNIFSGSPTPVELTKRSGNTETGVPDQPYVQATTVLGGEGTAQDRVFVGLNDARPAVKPKTATVDVFSDAAASPPGLASQIIEDAMPPSDPGQDGSAVRTASHASGVVYAAFYSPLSTTKANIVVVRDDQWGKSPEPFGALTNGANRGTIVGSAVTYNGTASLLGQRAGRSQISIAVDPNNASSVWLVWGDAEGSKITLHLRHSTDKGKTWGLSDLRTIFGATNPAVAVNSTGQVGLLYQQAGGISEWFTQVEISKDDFASAPTPILLSIAPKISGENNYIGDYEHMMAVGKDFFGVFSAENSPAASHFPDVDNLIIQRQHSGDSLQSGNGFALKSVDPFFFHIAMVEPVDDFFVRDWTEPGGHDKGQEPSTHPIFYTSSDVWNRLTNDSGSPGNAGAPPHADPQPGENFAFLRIGRKKTGAAVDITPHFFYADFGVGMKYTDAGAGPLPMTFPAGLSETTLADGAGYAWTLPEEHSSHVCMGVEIETPSDPFALPDLKNHVPGWPTLDTAILYDNNKAQRNIIYPPMKMSSKAHYYALARNAANVPRSLCLRLDSGVDVVTRFTSIQIDACGIVTTPYRPGSTVCLPGMAAGEVRAVKVTVDVPASAQGLDLPLAFTEVTVPGLTGKPRDGFALSPVATTVEDAAHANLVFQAAVFGRLAALYNDPLAAALTAKTRDLLQSSNLSPTQYAAFLQQVGPYLSRLTGLVPRPTSLCAPSPYGDLDRLLGPLQSGDPALITPAHNDYLQTLDIAITLSQIAVNGPGSPQKSQSVPTTTTRTPDAKTRM